jgi:HAD superfamily phosphatase (TIGR01668 family)
LRKLLTPDLILPTGVTGIDLQALKRRGIQGMILDVDDTLLVLGSSDLDPLVIEWVEQAKQDFQLWIASNNPSTRLIGSVAHALDIPFINNAKKPFRRSLRRVIAEMELTPMQVAIVGDRLLTDILGGNRLGLYTVLVLPPGPTRSIGAKFIRAVERRIYHLTRDKLAVEVPRF